MHSASRAVFDAGPVNILVLELGLGFDVGLGFGLGLGAGLLIYSGIRLGGNGTSGFRARIRVGVSGQGEG